MEDRGQCHTKQYKNDFLKIMQQHMAKLFSWHKSKRVWANLDQENKKNKKFPKNMRNLTP